jgi:hypothetical protein
MEKFVKNIKQDTEPEVYSCCGTTCDSVLSVQQLKDANTSSAKHYEWYLASQADNEKLRVEITVLKRELRHAKKVTTWLQGI